MPLHTESRTPPQTRPGDEAPHPEPALPKPPVPVSEEISRRGRPGYDRETLLTVCVQVFNRHGYGSTSMGMLARELGITKSAIYHHVQSKEEILDYALRRALDSLERMIEEVQTHLPEDPPPGDPSPGDSAEVRPARLSAVRQLEEIIRGSVRVLVEQMPYVTLLLRLRGNSPVELEALARRRRITRVVEGLVAQGQEDGELRQDVSGKSAPRLMLGMVNSIVDWYQPGGSGTVEDLADTAVAMVFSGLRS